MCGAQSSNTRQGGDCHEGTKKISMKIINYKKGSRDSSVCVCVWGGGGGGGVGLPLEVNIVFHTLHWS